jgi:uncharacterized iron-regulated membrane protein
MTDLKVVPDGGGDAGPAAPGGGLADPRRGRGADRRTTVARWAGKPRGGLVKVHRWLSFVLMAWLVVISATGVVLVLGDHINHWTGGHLYRHGDGDLGVDAAMEAAKQSVPEDAAVIYVTLPANASGVYLVTFEVPEGESTVYVDPATARVNDVRDPEEGFVWWMYRGHMYLWQDEGIFAVDAAGGTCDSPSGLPARSLCTVIPEGDDMIAWFAVGWMVVLGTGFYLWYWPGVKRWARAVRVRRRRGAFTFNLDLHKAVGFLAVGPLLIVAFTGAAFAFPLMKNLYERTTPAQADFELWTPPEEGVLSVAPPLDARPITADEAVEAVRAAHPTWRVDSVTPPADETGVYSFWVDKGFSTWTAEGGGGNTMINVDQYSAALVYEGSPEDGNVFDQAWDDWSFPLHSGDAFGEPSRILWVFVALSPLLLGGTGLVMNRIRHRKRKRRVVESQERPLAIASSAPGANN